MARFPQFPRFPIVSPTPVERSIGRSTSAMPERWSHPASGSHRGVPLLRLHLQRPLQIVLVGLLLCSCALSTTTTTPAAVQPGPVNGQGAQHGAITSDTVCQHPSQCGTPPLHYKNGPVVHHPHVYLVFWGSWWQSAAGIQSGIASGLADLFRELAGGQYNNILTHYYDNSPNDPNAYVHNDVTLAASWTDTVNPIGSGSQGSSGSPLTMHEIDNVALNAVQVNNWPRNSPTLSTLVLVFPQPGTIYDSSFNAGDGVCGKHSWIDNTTGSLVIDGMVRYPPDTTFCEHEVASSNQALGDMQYTATHEYAEMVTDPEAGYVDSRDVDHTAWLTDDGFEVADLCGEHIARPYNPANDPQDKLFVTELYDRTAANPSDACEWMYGQEFPSPDTVPPFNGKHTVQGAILMRYTQLGGVSGSLGAPMSEETPLVNAGGVEDGQVSYFQGTPCGSPNDRYGAIYSTYSGTGSILGCIDQYYANTLGGPHSSSVPLGYPLGDQQTIPGGYYNQFQGTACGAQTYGAIYYGVTKGWVVGCIEQYYEDLGSHDTLTVPLSFPVGGQQQIPGGWVNYFHGTKCGTTYYGAIYYGVTKGWVVGCIEQYYEGLGGPSSSLSFPVNGQHQITGGYYNDFNGAACPGRGNLGSIYYGSHVGWLKGCIAVHYKDVGGPDKLGFPIGGEQNIPGGYVNYFDGHGCSSGTGPSNSSSAIYNSSAGTYLVEGCIYYAYIHNFGGYSGPLGFPTKDEFWNGTNYESDFVGGKITWVNGTAVVTLKCVETGQCN